ncbi:MAG: glutamine--fructose-6-phosphate transaminase (isomerizing) [Leptospiraceae bacterium]|nr:glutamine--fructose-6-phosphate transaminase (isomerizing) [Leptospiraceae bacterium]
MCGIVGYVGGKSVESVLISGLKKLEYRGYDSAGIAVIDGGELSVRKAVGKIAELEKLLHNQPLGGTSGIAHTRWATHGEPSVINAHPHCNKEQTIAVVHNGIFENYNRLKAELLDDGFVFTSDTDTEVAPHLVEKYLNEGFSVEEAFVRMLRRLEGQYAIAMVCEQAPDRIFFARRGSPLVVARGKEEFMIASDLPALVPLAHEAIFLADEEWGFISPKEVQILRLNGGLAERSWQVVSICEEDIEKGPYPHRMLKEIHEQPEVVERILSKRLDDTFIHFPEMQMGKEYLARIGRILIQACGTSLNAGMIGRMYLEQFAHTSAETDYSSEWRYRNPLASGDSLVIGISQSGETADTLAGLREAKAKFLRVLCFLNNVHSTMAREADAIVELMAGPEIGVASTKAFTAQVLSLLLFALYVGSIKWLIPANERRQILNEVRQVPEKMRRILVNQTVIQEIAEFLKNKNDTLFLGRTYNFPMALEGALKLKEVSYIHASGYAGGEFKHGPLALVSENVPVVIIAPQGEIRSKMISNLKEAQSRGGKIISIVTEGDDEIKKESHYAIEIPPCPESLSPLLVALPLQLLAYYTAVARGCDVDRPRNLAKSVTVE